LEFQLSNPPLESITDLTGYICLLKFTLSPLSFNKSYPEKTLASPTEDF